MKNMLTLLAASAACVAIVGVAAGQTGTNATVRLSWNSCDPQRPDTLFTAPVSYKLVISAADFTPGPTADDHVATDMTLLVSTVGGAAFPDAWRFDDSGCQTDDMLSFSSGPLSKSCPALRGANPLAITAYFYDPEAMTAPIRLGIAYDAVSPAPGTRYTMWQLSFDMTNAVTGPGTPGVSCGGADTQLHITCTEATLSTMRGESAPFHTAPGDVDFVTWNVGPPVPAVAATWGRLKGLYR